MRQEHTFWAAGGMWSRPERMCRAGKQVPQARKNLPGKHQPELPAGIDQLYFAVASDWKCRRSTWERHGGSKETFARRVSDGHVEAVFLPP